MSRPITNKIKKKKKKSKKISKDICYDQKKINKIKIKKYNDYFLWSKIKRRQSCLYIAKAFNLLTETPTTAYP